MFKPVPVFIGLRYLRAKQSSYFVSFMAFISMFGIALGVMVLITVLSVMNGFDYEIKQRIFAMVPAMTVTSVQGSIKDWQALMHRLQRQAPAITTGAPFISGEVLLEHNHLVQPAVLSGVLPQQAQHVTQLADRFVQGRLAALTAGTFGIVLGEDLARRLQILLHDKMIVMTPQVTLSVVGIIPHYRRFTVVGIFKAGSGFGFDSSLAFTYLTDAQRLFKLPDQAVTGMHMRVADVYQAPLVAKKLEQRFPSLMITTWADQFGAFFHAIKLEKNMMFLILLLIIAVAIFNLVSMLVMVVFDKAPDIAILKTMGATPRMIMQIFIVEGGIIGLVGILLGVIGGVLLAWHVTGLVEFLQQVLHTRFLTENVYFIDYLPSKVNYWDVFNISLVTFCLSWLATLYPAWRAAQIDPVKSLRYE